jgi:hypothetical protein
MTSPGSVLVLDASTLRSRRTTEARQCATANVDFVQATLRGGR